MFEKEAEKYLKDSEDYYFDDEPLTFRKLKQIYEDGAEFGYNKGLKAGRPKWHKLREEYPDADKLVRVRLMSGMEYICETCYYEPTEDEIGYGKLVINFYELNGEWVDDNDIISWCEVPQYTEE